MRTHRRIRIFLLMLAFGLAAVRFFPFLYENWAEIYVDLPKVESDSPILIVAQNPPLYKNTTKQTNLKEIIQKRDLSNYEIGKTFSNCRVSTAELEN